MREVILGVAVSLDGYIEGPNGEYDWCFVDQDYGMQAFLQDIDTMFIGRKSYELVQSMPGGLSGQWPALKPYVFSNTLTAPENSIDLMSGDIGARVKEIKSAPGKGIWLFGGASLTSALMQLGLVDQLWLAVHPVLLGSGTPLFKDLPHRLSLRLLTSKSYSTGLVSLKYRIATDTN
jgi:dihydrofolate reductase